jgi:hypothetical protein
MSVSVTLDNELLYPSNYIGAADCKGKDVSLTIENVQIDELMLVGGKKQKKPVLYFEKTVKMLVLNKTNATVISEQHGTEAKGWIGKRITIYPTTTRCKGKTVPCVRVRPGTGTAAADGIPADEHARILAQEQADANR